MGKLYPTNIITTLTVFILIIDMFQPRRGCCIPLSAGVLVLGVVGVALGLAALTAYAVLQAPTLRY